MEVVEQQLLLLPSLSLGDDPQVQVHLEGTNLASLPVLPEPPGNVEQDRLEREKRK